LDELDEDLSEIFNAYVNFKQEKLQESEYQFSIKLSQIDEYLKINPQLFLPSLNETLKNVAEIDGLPNWSVMPLSQLDRNIKIFKGPRFKSENLIVETKINGSVEPYYTPSAVLQEKSDSVKLIDVSKASKTQLKTITTIRLHQGDIVITRSGSIGRVAYITSKHHRAIASDDLIRVKIDNEDIRLYVYYFLQTKFGQDQMLRNEYGAVQQHLEPKHIKDLLIPVPNNWVEVQPIINKTKKIIQLREAIYELSTEAFQDITCMLQSLTEKVSAIQSLNNVSEISTLDESFLEPEDPNE
jgi:preprotein translocase subunit YajC